MQEFAAPALGEIDDDDTVVDHLFDTLSSDPTRVSFRRQTAAGWQPVTHEDFMRAVTAAAKGLVAIGVGQGDRVGLMARTRYEWTVMDYAVLVAGAVTVPIYETSSADQVRWILSDSGAVAVVVETAEHLATVESVLPDLPGLTTWCIEDGAMDVLTEAGTAVGDATLAERRAQTRASSVATIIYTSGTTGRPKGCPLTHRNMLAAVSGALSGALREVFLPGRSTLLFLPLAHVMGRDIQFGCTNQGVVMGHSHDIPRLVDDLGEFRPDFLLSVPRVFEKVYNMASAKAAEEGKGRIFDIAVATAVEYSQALDTGGPSVWLRLRHAVFDRLVYAKLRARLGGNVSWALSAGAPLGARLGHFYRGIGITIYEAYGMTENCGPATISSPGHVKVGSVGRPIPGCTIRIADDGEVLMRGEHVFSGYWNNTEATRETIDEDGWLHTGDIGELDEQGFLTITGRKKDLIVTAGGKNVAPAVLEDIARAHRLVSQIMVVGDNRPFVAALVTLDREFLPTWLELQQRPADTPVEALVDDPAVRAEVQVAIDAANAAVSRAESIRAFTILVEDFSIESGHLTPSMKLKRSVVATDHAGTIDDLYA